MKEHFNRRSLIFYGCAISSVVALFTTTTAYGEKNLQAPRRVDGRYPLTSQMPIPCFQTQPVYLLLQQSGIFFTASLLPANASQQDTQIAQDRPSLSGQWRQDQLTLEGTAGRIANCPDKITINGKFTQDTLNGTLNFSSIATAIPFAGDRQAPLAKTETH